MNWDEIFVKTQPLSNWDALLSVQRVSTLNRLCVCVVTFLERMETANKQLATRDCEGTEDNRKTISQLLTQSTEN